LILSFWATASDGCKLQLRNLNTLRDLQVVTVNFDPADRLQDIRSFVKENRIRVPVLQGSDDVQSIYNILYSYLFDRHRDLTLPTSFLVNAKGEIVKVYQGLAENIEQDARQIPETEQERIRNALPFPGTH